MVGQVDFDELGVLEPPGKNSLDLGLALVSDVTQHLVAVNHHRLVLLLFLLLRLLFLLFAIRHVSRLAIG